MLPSLASEAPASHHWLHEIKHDVIAPPPRRWRQAQAFTRNRNDWTARYPGIVAAAEKLRCRAAVIDGEVIVKDEAGRSDFTAVQEAIRWHPDTRGRMATAAARPKLHAHRVAPPSGQYRPNWRQPATSMSEDGRSRRYPCARCCCGEPHLRGLIGTQEVPASI
jgi:hypothetical protein